MSMMDVLLLMPATLHVTVPGLTNGRHRSYAIGRANR